jgi:hypothetical protein
MDTNLESYLLGRLAAIEEETRKAAPAPEPAPTPRSLVEQWMDAKAAQAAQDAHFLENVEAIAGIKPPFSPPTPPAPPATISRAAKDFQRQFSKHLEAVADGRTLVVD